MSVVCRIGQVEGPFRASLFWGDGTPKDGKDRPTSKDRTTQYWIVRTLGTTLEDVRFFSREAAAAYWASLPPYIGA